MYITEQLHYTTESGSLPNNLNKFEKKGLSIFLSKREGADEGSHCFTVISLCIKIFKRDLCFKI